jgi:hypothetical protein
MVRSDIPEVSCPPSRIHTNKSSAVGDDVFFSSVGEAISGDLKFCRLLVLVGSRKGFRETGRAGGLSKGEVGGLLRLGEPARLRKGLFEERLRVRPADADRC